MTILDPVTFWFGVVMGVVCIALAGWQTFQPDDVERPVLPLIVIALMFFFAAVLAASPGWWELFGLEVPGAS